LEGLKKTTSNLGQEVRWMKGTHDERRVDETTVDGQRIMVNGNQKTSMTLITDTYTYKHTE
jgi:hypothetical protein